MSEGFGSKNWWKIAVIAFVCLVILSIFLLVEFVAPRTLHNEIRKSGLSTERTNSEVSLYPRSCCYQHLRMNPTTNEKSIRTFNLETPFRNDFLFYHDSESEHYHLISKFESTKYMCTGTCFCEQNDASRRSSATKVVGNGLIYLLAASTTLIASRIAKNYFDEKCHESYSEMCPNGAVVSEIDNCEEEVGVVPSEKETDEKCDTCVCEGKQFSIYLCEGNCIPSTKYDDIEEKKNLVEKYKHECYKKRREQGINTAIFCENEIQKIDEEKGIVTDEEDRMTLHFLMNHLTDEYCEAFVPEAKEVFDFPICMAPQLFPPTDELTDQIVDANVKCTNLKDAWDP